jgi:hypothetical protein
MRNLFQCAALICIAFLTACNNPKTAEQIAGSAASTQKETQETNRAAAAAGKKVIASAYYYKTIASFKGGKNTTNIQAAVDLSNTKVNLVVMFESGATWAVPFASGDFSTTADDRFNGLMAEHGLAIAKHFEIDDMNEGLVLEPNKGNIANPVEAAREISMIESVLMVEVKEIPLTEQNKATVSK